MPEFEVIIPDYLTESETENTTEEVEEETTADYSATLSEIINQTELINENLVAVQRAKRRNSLLFKRLLCRFTIYL